MMRRHVKLAQVWRVLPVVGFTVALQAQRASHRYQLVGYKIPVKHAGASPLRVLHLSDMHFFCGREDLVAWLNALAAGAGQDFDLVVLTGDMLATDFGDAYLARRALQPFFDSGVAGAYVFGSHDRYENRLGNPLSYLWGSARWRGFSGGRGSVGQMLGRYGSGRVGYGSQLQELLSKSDWLDLNNSSGVLQVNDWRVELSGVDDPHINRDRYVGFTRVLSGVDDGFNLRGSVAVRVGLAHAPYARVLDSFAVDGADIVFCGHTHGGQVCLPGGRAIVSNCDLDPGYASGVFSWCAGVHGQVDASGESVCDEGRARMGGYPVRGCGDPSFTRVVVSPGLGTSPYTPWRVFCRPAAYLLELG